MSQKKNKIIFLISFIVVLLFLGIFTIQHFARQLEIIKSNDILAEYNKCRLHLDEAQSKEHGGFVTPPAISCTSSSKGVRLININDKNNSHFMNELFNNSSFQRLFVIADVNKIVKRFLQDAQAHPSIITGQKNIIKQNQYQVCAIIIPKVDQSQLKVIPQNSYQDVASNKYDSFLCSRTLINESDSNIFSFMLPVSSLTSFSNLIFQLYLIPVQKPISTEEFMHSFNDYPRIFQYIIK